MLKALAVFFVVVINLYAIKPSVENLEWQNGVSLSQFLEANGMPYSLYNGLEDEDKELAAEIKAGAPYQILRDKSNQISQVLIPINEELQIHIFKDKKDKYKLEFIPISYQTEDKILSFKIEKSVSEDIFNYTGSGSLANSFHQIFKGESVDFKKLNRGDRIVIVYTQKRRLGRIFGNSQIHAAFIETKNKRYVMYEYDDKFYDRTGKKSDKFLLIRPILNARVTSPFTLKRYHPILRRYRAHLGVDYGAPRGTPIRAAGDGLVKFVGVKNGYGRVVIIRHAGGYETLYAHLNDFAKGLRSGINVKQGTLIAYVGSSGMSTGPHLHFGLYLNNNPVNPESAIKVVKALTDQKEAAKFKQIVNENDEKIKRAIAEDKALQKFQSFPDFIEF